MFDRVLKTTQEVLHDIVFENDISSPPSEYFCFIGEHSSIFIVFCWKYKACCCLLLLGIHSIKGWTATVSHGITRKRRRQR